MPSLKHSREPGNEYDGCLATIETMKETFVIVQAIPHEEIRDSVCQNEAHVKRGGKGSHSKDSARTNSNPMSYRHSIFGLSSLVRSSVKHHNPSRPPK